MVEEVTRPPKQTPGSKGLSFALDFTLPLGATFEATFTLHSIGSVVTRSLQNAEAWRLCASVRARGVLLSKDPPRKCCSVQNPRRFPNAPLTRGTNNREVKVRGDHIDAPPRRSRHAIEVVHRRRPLSHHGLMRLGERARRRYVSNTIARAAMRTSRGNQQ
jgi:hypothetical protein